MMVATFESTELLIKYVREHRILYDPQYPGYKNGRKEHVWEEIGRRLNISGEEAKKKWRNLRDTHTKYLKSRNIPAPPGRKNYKSWQWAVQMDFFKPFLTSNESLRYEPDLMLDNSDMQFEANGNLSNSSMGDLQNMYDSFNFEVSQPTSTIDAIDGDPLNLFSAKRKRSCEDSNEVTEPDCSEEAENKWGTSDFDAMEHIFLGYAKIVKSFSPRRQAEAKMKVAQVIMQQEIEHFEEMAVDSKT